MSLAPAVVLLLGSALVTEVVVRGTTTTVSQVGELAPTPLEAFAAQPGAKVVWSRPIGQLDSAASRATVSAVAVEEVTSTPQIMRGLRIDLAHLEPNPQCDLRYWDWAIMCARPNAAIYLEEDRLERVLALWAERGAAAVHLGNPAGGMTTYRKGGSQTPSGLIIVGYTLEGRQPKELSALIERGILELKNAPR